MPSTSETSFGAKLRKGQDILTYTKGYVGYNPPRQEETIEGFSGFLDSIININKSEASLQENYSKAVDNRQKAFKKDDGSVEKLLSPIAGAVQSLYGKKSKEHNMVASIIKQMRASKLIKPPADPNKPDAKQAISNSERSYGSMTQFFNNLINTISQFENYSSSNNKLVIQNLEQTATSITKLNNQVAEKYQALKADKSNRSALYNELKDRVQRIKAYVKAQYGIKSNEYNLIKGIKI